MQFDPEPLPGLRVIDIARAALAEFADESAKIQLRTGDASSAWTANQDGSTDSSEETQLPTPGLSEDEPLLAFLNEARPKGAVDADLRAIFEANPRAVAILDHCRGVGRPSVQAGIADFMKHAQGEYHFRLFSDLTTGMATSNLGIVYPDADAAEVQRCLADLAQLFSERLDPLWLACREQELIGIVNTFKDEANGLSGQLQDLAGEHQLLANRNKELEKRISQLEKRKTQLEQRTAGLKQEKKVLQSRNSRLKEEKKVLQSRNSRLKEERLLLDSQLSEFRSAGRYKLADAVTKNVLRVPGAKALARRTRPRE
jgi:hypothetical protein